MVASFSGGADAGVVHNDVPSALLEGRSTICAMIEALAGERRLPSACRCCPSTVEPSASTQGRVAVGSQEEKAIVTASTVSTFTCTPPSATPDT
jgi:hypothetical protein